MGKNDIKWVYSNGEVASVMARCTACANASVAQCAHQAAASFIFLCSAFFGALHFFCMFFFYRGMIPQGACV